MVGGGALAAPAKRGPGRPRKADGEAKPAKAQRTKPRGARKNPWAGLPPAEKLARVNAIRKGRGLPLKKSL